VLGIVSVGFCVSYQVKREMIHQQRHCTNVIKPFLSCRGIIANTFAGMNARIS